MEIINKTLENYFVLANNLKQEFNNKKYSFIKAVYIHGSFARGEITPKESDINLMIFTKKKDILKKDIDLLSSIKENLDKKYSIKIEFKINNIEKNSLKNITTDMFYPYLYDFILNSFFIYGERIEDKLLNILKAKTFFEFSFETTSVFSKIRIDFLESYFQENKYKMYYNLYKYSRLLKQLKVNEEKIENLVKKITDYKNIDKEEILKYILKFEELLEKTDLKKIFENNKKLKLFLGSAIGGLVYNTKTKKILIIEDTKQTCSFWSQSKNAKTKGKESLSEIKEEIEKNTGIENITIVNEKIGECHNWYEKEKNTFKKIQTEYYYATTNCLKKINSKAKWIKLSEVKEYVSSPCLGYITKSFYQDFIKKIKEKSNKTI